MSEPTDPQAIRARGREIRNLAQGAKADALARVLGELDPDLPDWTDSFIFGRVWARPALPFEERMLVAIGCLASLGHLPQLRNYLFGALQAGVPEAKVQDALAMTCVYAGFPAALSALDCWRQVRAAHASRGDEGAAAIPAREGLFPHDYFHVGIVVPDLDAAIAEAEAALQLTFNPPHDSRYGEDDIRVTYAREGPPYVELIQGTPGGRWDTAAGPRLDHIGYFSGDLDADAARLETAGLLIDIDGRTDGAPFTYHRAPAMGMRIELVATRWRERLMRSIRGS